MISAFFNQVLNLSSIFFINLLNIKDFIFNHSIRSSIACIIAIILIPYLYHIETLFHELGHTFATYLSYKHNKFRLPLNLRPNIEIKVSISKGSLKGDKKSRGETNSDYRKRIDILHPLFIKQEIFIARGGVVFGTIFLLIPMIFVIILIPPSVLQLAFLILFSVFIFFNLYNYFKNSNESTPNSDRFKVLKYKKELKNKKKSKKVNE